MFQFDEDKKTNSIHVIIDGTAMDCINKIKEVLELDNCWPIIPIAIEKLYHASVIHQNSKELLRDIMIVSKDESQGCHLYDIEEVKIDAKRLQVNGLED